MPSFHAPLRVHLAWHPDALTMGTIAQALTEWLAGPASARADVGVSVPVVFHSKGAAPGAPPWDVPVAASARPMLVLLIDNTMVADPAWRSWVDRQVPAVRASGGRIVALSYTGNGRNLSRALEGHLVEPLHHSGEPADWTPETLLRVTHELVRHVRGGESARLFISHAKLDGRRKALAMKRFLDTTRAGLFFDEVDLASDDRFDEALLRALECSSVLVILTDSYAGRTWCRYEALHAKLAGCSMLVALALSEGEGRNCPYLGNLPTFPWKESRPALRRMVSLLLREELRERYAKLLYAALEQGGYLPPGSHHAGRPPELLTLEPDMEGVLVHPEPPLPSQERAMLARHRPGLRLQSPIEALAGAEDATPLRGKVVALSISNAPDFEVRGWDEPQVHRTWLAFTRHLLAAGAAVAYGGDLRGLGYTVDLFELVDSYRDQGRLLPSASVHSFLSWPISLGLDQASYPDTVQFHLQMAPPADVTVDSKAFVAPDTPEHRYAWARSLNLMRDDMARLTHARVLLGGNTRAVSPFPGVAEEAMRHLFTHDEPLPLYVIGAFGGMSHAIGRALAGEQPEELSEAYQLHDDLRRESRRYHDEHIVHVSGEGPVDYAGSVARLNALGWAGLNNGLSVEDNQRLFETLSVEEMVGLVLMGMRRRWGG